jgi:hypothetical protein
VLSGRRNQSLLLLRLAGPALAVAALAWSFRDTDQERVASLLGRVGPLAVLLLLPQLAALAIECAAWWLALDSMGRRLPYAGLLRTRFATEALAQTLPCGALVGESLKPALLARNCGADLATSLAGMAARKWLQMTSQAAYIAGFALLGWAVLAQISTGVLHAAGLGWLLLAAAGLLVLLAAASYVALAHGHLSQRVHAALLRLPWRRLRRHLQESRGEFAESDRLLRRFFSRIGASPLPLLVCLLAWLCEAGETLLILWLLGVDLPAVTVGVLETAASFLRNTAVLLPAGLGVQDLGYLAFLRALELSDALNVAAAFLLLKRGKELIWAMFGYALLAADLRPKLQVVS